MLEDLLNKFDANLEFLAEQVVSYSTGIKDREFCHKESIAAT